jgi:hypothetical protein
MRPTDLPRLRRTARTFVLIGVPLLLAPQGCTLDLVEPDLFAARFFTTLVLRPDGEGERFFLDAKLEPGIGREGRRAVPDLHLEIDSSPRFPALIAPGDPPAEYEWKNETGIVYSPGDRIRLRLPTVAGLPEPPILELPAGIALTPEVAVQLEPGEDLVLHLEPPAVPPSFLRWSLSLTSLTAGPPFLLGLEGVSEWPAEIRIPSSHLPQSYLELKATVRVIAEFEPAGTNAGYEILGRIDYVMERRVVRTGPILTTTMEQR